MCVWKEVVVFLEAEWPGFEPRTSSIRKGRSIHSAIAPPGLEVHFQASNEYVVYSKLTTPKILLGSAVILGAKYVYEKIRYLKQIYSDMTRG